MTSFAVTPRLIFDPSPDVPVEPAAPVSRARVATFLFTFYRDRLAWLALAVTAVMLAYVGGAAMFWFHAEVLGEGGPNIAWYAHWLLDSTFGFIVLAPALGVIIPVATRAAVTVAGIGRRGVLTAAYAILAGGVFALITTPGPIAHDMFVARGTWIANHVTQWIGDANAPLAPVQEYAVPAALTQQLGFGVMIYLVLTALSVLLVRGIVATARMRVRPVPAHATIDR